MPGFLLRSLLLTGPLGLALLAAPASGAQVDPGLQRELADGRDRTRVAVAVTLRMPAPPPPGALRRARIAALQRRVLAALPRDSFALKRRYGNLAGLAGWASARGVDALGRHPDVERVYRDGIVRATLAESVALVGAADAQAAGFTGEGVGVAVLDTGIDRDHPDLADDLVAERCFCDDHPSPQFGCCPNGDGSQSGAGSAEDDEGHGTSVSGIVTSSGAVAAPGVAPDAGIVAIKVLGSTGAGSFSDVDAGLDWALSNRIALGIRVVNLSLGDDVEHTDPLASPCTGSNTATAIGDLRDAGVPVFVSSGNSGFDAGLAFPACVPEAISVGGVYDAALGTVAWCGNAQCTTTLCTDAATEADRFICHTNSDTTLDLLAPGYRIDAPTLGGGTTAFGGTSAASPFAAGYAALLFEADPSLSAEAVRTLLRSFGTGVTSPDNGLTFVRTDARQAVAAGAGDTDLDGVLDDGDASGIAGDARCAGGATQSCDDNCPGIPNAAQPDADADAVGDGCDVCPFEADPSQTDADLDGVGDACTCGDVAGGGTVTDADADALRSALAVLVAGVPYPEKCNVIGPLDPADADSDGLADECNLADLVALRRALAAPPPLAQLCAAALP